MQKIAGKPVIFFLLLKQYTFVFSKLVTLYQINNQINIYYIYLLPIITLYHVIEKVKRM